MFKFLAGLFHENKKKLGSYQKIVEKINALEPKITKLSNTQLTAQTEKFRRSIEAVRSQTTPGDAQALTLAEQNILDELLPEVFATVREAARRVLGPRPYDVQLLAAL